MPPTIDYFHNITISNKKQYLLQKVEYSGIVIFGRFYVE